jgi:cytochrome c553
VKSAFKSLVFAVAAFALGAVVQRYYDVHRLSTTAPPAPVAKAPAEGSPAAPKEQDFSGVHFDLEPLWAYGFADPAKPGDKAQPQGIPTRGLRPNQDPAEQTKPRHAAGSSASYSLVDIRDQQNVIDWFPSDHPRMPDVVMHGPSRMGPKARGCASCHLPTGKGRPENAQPVGLPAAYFLRQIQDFRTGLRHSADPRKPNTNTMIELARGMTDSEVMDAANYFGSMKWTPWVRVVEANLVPKTRINANLFLPVSLEKTEPIAGRIVEMPENEEQAETYRNPHSGFVAYVPLGSIKRGKDLVTTGGMRIVNGQIVQGKTTACGTCHGIDLMGVADVPPIAGRSPSYIARQIWDMQQGTRNGASAQLMKMVIANLTPDDIEAIAAYVSSLTPPPAAAAREQLAIR